MNPSIKTMKDSLVAYHGKVKKADEIITKALEEFKPEVAKERIAQVRSDLDRERTNTLNAIYRVRDAEKAKLEKFNELNPADITEDAKLLSAGIKMNQADFDKMCQKYEHNGTMCRILAEYAEKNNREAQALHPKEIFPAGYLHTMNLPNMKSMARKWDNLASSAESIIRHMEGNGIGCGADNPLVIASVESFGGDGE